MATYVVVDKDTDPLGPNEVRAGDTIDASNGDIFIISESVSDNIKFESSTGDPTNFEIRFETTNTSDFDVEITENLDVGIVISEGVDLSEVDIKADKALAVVMTAGDNVSLGKFEGSSLGTDVLTIGHGFTTNHDIKLNGGDNFLTIGDNATIRDIESDDGNDTIFIGNGLIADDIKTKGGADAITIGDNARFDNIETGDGDDSITLGDNIFANDIKSGEGDDALVIGDGASLHNIETDKGADSITIGDDLIAKDIKTGDGADELSIADGAVVDDINTGKGNDTVSVGDDFTADKVETKEGYDVVLSGAGGSIKDLDGGKDNDKLRSETDYPGASNFENIVCFMRGSRMETDIGNVPIESLRVGDRIRTADHGYQIIRWINSTSVPGRGLHAPVRIAAGALGNTHPLWVSQQHRMLFSGVEVELYFGEPEVLVAAKHLAGLPGIELIELPQVEFFHMLFDRHEIVFAEGIPSESFYPGDVGMNALSKAACAEIYSLFPELEADSGVFGESARYVLKAYEASILAA